MPAAPQQQPNAIVAWIADHHGVISGMQARALGGSDRTLRRAVERGAFTELFPGVFLSSHWPCDRVQLLAAVTARNRRAAIAFTTAGSGWTLRRMPHDELIHILVPHGSSPDMPGLGLHRCRRIDGVDITERQNLRITSPPRTLCDCADMIGVEGRSGTRTMAAVLRSRPAWRAALQSDLEARVLAEVQRQRLEPPIPQWP